MAVLCYTTVGFVVIIREIECSRSTFELQRKPLNADPYASLPLNADPHASLPLNDEEQRNQLSQVSNMQFSY